MRPQTEQQLRPQEAGGCGPGPRGASRHQTWLRGDPALPPEAPGINSNARSAPHGPRPPLIPARTRCPRLGMLEGAAPTAPARSSRMRPSRPPAAALVSPTPRSSQRPPTSRLREHPAGRPLPSPRRQLVSAPCTPPRAGPLSVPCTQNIPSLDKYRLRGLGDLGRNTRSGTFPREARRLGASLTAGREAAAEPLPQPRRRSPGRALPAARGGPRGPQHEPGRAPGGVRLMVESMESELLGHSLPSSRASHRGLPGRAGKRV